MAPNGEAIGNTFTQRTTDFSKLTRVSNDSLHRTISDISFEVSKEVLNFKEVVENNNSNNNSKLPPISEVELVKCGCCDMSEECTPEYIERVRSKFMGKWVCGLCAEAVTEEKKKDGGKKMEEALSIHMHACAKFNKLGRAYPVLFQADAMREILKKSCRMEGRGLRAKSFTPRDHKGAQNKGGIARTSSCIPAITREMNNISLAN